MKRFPAIKQTLGWVILSVRATNPRTVLSVWASLGLLMSQGEFGITFRGKHYFTLKCSNEILNTDTKDKLSAASVQTLCTQKP